MRSEPYTGDLRDLVAEESYSADRPVYVLCPVHDDNNRPSLAVYNDHAHCYTCGAHLSRRQFSDAYSAEAKWQAKLKRQTGAVRRVSTPTVQVDVEALIRSSQAILQSAGEKREYLHQRGLSDITIYTYQLGYSGSAYTIPLLDEPRTVRFRRDDAVTTDGNKYWGLRGQNDTRLYPHAPSGPVVLLTEGEFDALLLRQHGHNAFSLTNGNLAMPPKEWLREVFANRFVTLVRDQDKAGREGSERLYRALVEAGVRAEVFSWSPDYYQGKDVTEVWQHSPEHFERLLFLLRTTESMPVV